MEVLVFLMLNGRGYSAQPPPPPPAACVSLSVFSLASSLSVAVTSFPSLPPFHLILLLSSSIFPFDFSHLFLFLLGLLLYIFFHSLSPLPTFSAFFVLPARPLRLSSPSLSISPWLSSSFCPCFSWSFCPVSPPAVLLLSTS